MPSSEEKLALLIDLAKLISQRESERDFTPLTRH